MRKDSHLFDESLMRNIMTKKEFVAGILARREEKKIEKYVEGVLEGMSEEDLDCNFRMNGEDIFDFKVTDKS